jgi:hypothetical protein
MHWFLAREQLFVGQNVTNSNVMKLVSHGDIEGLSVDITNNAKELQPYLMHNEGNN